MTQQPAAHPHGDQPILTASGNPAATRGAVILVHGRGATASSILTLATELANPEVAYFAPQAASGTWYPYSFMAERAENEPFLSSALHRLDEVLSRVEAAGIPNQRTLLLGFSQGACLVLEYVLRRTLGDLRSEHRPDRTPIAFGGVVALTGGLIGPPSTRWDIREPSPGLDRTPVFLGTSDVDPHVPLARAQESAAVFESLGADVVLKVYRGFGHSVNEDELDHVRTMLSLMLSRTLS